MVQAQDCLLPMGVTSENVAHRFGVTRQEQDQAAVSQVDLSIYDHVYLAYIHISFLFLLLGRFAS